MLFQNSDFLKRLLDPGSLWKENKEPKYGRIGSWQLRIHELNLSPSQDYLYDETVVRLSLKVIHGEVIKIKMSDVESGLLVCIADILDFWIASNCSAWNAVLSHLFDGWDNYYVGEDIETNLKLVPALREISNYLERNEDTTKRINDFIARFLIKLVLLHWKGGFDTILILVPSYPTELVGKLRSFELTLYLLT
jgi:hypothetical protein